MEVARIIAGRCRCDAHVHNCSCEWKTRLPFLQSGVEGSAALVKLLGESLDSDTNRMLHIVIDPDTMQLVPVRLTIFGRLSFSFAHAAKSVRLCSQ
jgi:hypothetical protein